MPPHPLPLLEAVDNLGTVMSNLLKTGAKMDGLKNKLATIKSAESDKLLESLKMYLLGVLDYVHIYIHRYIYIYIYSYIYIYIYTYIYT